LAHALLPDDIALVRRKEVDMSARNAGIDWPPPPQAETMVGLERMDNVHRCIADVLTQGVPGDFMECGVWRGGVAIFMRGALKAYGDASRVVWAADSFAGLPPPDEDQFPPDADNVLWRYDELAVSLEEVKRAFERYGLLDDRVRFLPGWFRDTLPKAPVDRLAILRLDGDMYESTMVALRSLWPKVSVGGYVIVDDYQPKHPGCVAAVDEFLAEHGPGETLQPAGTIGAYWKRTA
jgi:O-methyltransferase